MTRSPDRGGLFGWLRRPWRRSVGIAALILLAAVVPLPEPTGSTARLTGLDAVLHLLGHAALAASLAADLGCEDRGTVPAAAVAVLLSAAYGVGIELVQWPIPTRTTESSDALAGALGAAVGAGLWAIRGRIPGNRLQ